MKKHDILENDPKKSGLTDLIEISMNTGKH